jgi:hypothetical protein
MGIRTVAGFMIGFPEDTVNSIRSVLAYALAVNPTYANFNIVTPYPGTEFFQQVKEQIADFDFTKYTVYTPVMKYKNLTAEQVQLWHAKCFMRYFFRWEWLTSNAHLMWPKLRLLGVGRKYARQAAELLASKAESAGPPASSSDDAKPAAAPKPGALPILGSARELRTDPAHRHSTTEKPAASKKPS